MDKSFFARYRTTDGRPLLGGVRRGRTSRFGTRELAEARLQAIIDTHARGRVAGEVVGTSEYPEIFVHCGGSPAAIGGKCSGCGRTLTIRDAQAQGRLRLEVRVFEPGGSKISHEGWMATVDNQSINIVQVRAWLYEHYYRLRHGTEVPGRHEVQARLVGEDNVGIATLVTSCD